MIYLDHAATTKPYPEVLDVMRRSAEEEFFNPASAYKVAKDLGRSMQDAFRSLAEDLSCKPENLVHTSSATEATNHILKGLYGTYGKRLNHFVCLESDHDATLQTCKYLEQTGAKVSYIKPQRNGQILDEDLIQVLNDKTLCVSLLYVNNESGIVLDIDHLSSIIRQFAPNAFIHADLVQAWGKIPLALNQLDIDFASFSAHKIHGPKGSGLLYKRTHKTIDSLIHGGSQQGNWRAGTENLSTLKAMALASKIQCKTFADRKSKVKDYANIVKDTVLNLEGEINFPNSIPEILNVSFPGLRGETILHMLEAKEVYVSTSSACNAKSGTISHVLKACSIPQEVAQGSIRISLDATNTLDEIENFCMILEQEINTLRQWQAL